MVSIIVAAIGGICGLLATWDRRNRRELKQRVAELEKLHANCGSDIRHRDEELSRKDKQLNEAWEEIRNLQAEVIQLNHRHGRR